MFCSRDSRTSRTSNSKYKIRKCSSNTSLNQPGLNKQISHPVNRTDFLNQQIMNRTRQLMTKYHSNLSINGLERDLMKSPHNLTQNIYNFPNSFHSSHQIHQPSNLTDTCRNSIHSNKYGNMAHLADNSVRRTSTKLSSASLKDKIKKNNKRKEKEQGCNATATLKRGVQETMKSMKNGCDEYKKGETLSNFKTSVIKMTRVRRNSSSKSGKSVSANESTSHHVWRLERFTL